MTSQNQNKPYTIAHITHEAVEKIGGIGTVLEGMMTSPVYQSAVKRSILVGPMGGTHFESPLRRLGDHVNILYSSKDQIDTASWGRRFHPIERAFNTHLAYGIRHYEADDGSGRVGEAEVLLIDVSHPDEKLLNEFKARLWTQFNIDAAGFQTDWGFEEYCRLAEPAFYAISALIPDEDLPGIIISHEFMGMCTALKAELDGNSAFRTLFHAHECATARRIVEKHDGHDTAFYNIMELAEKEGHYVEDVFGDQMSFFRHALVCQTYQLNGVIAVGDPTAQEMKFLGKKNHDSPIDLVYNGIPTISIDLDEKKQARSRLDEWIENVTGNRFDYLMTHVTRPVISKGMWRDFKVADHLDPLLKKENGTALFIILTCGAPPRSFEQVNEMAEEYGWPDHHHEDYPDLVGMEGDLYKLIIPFNTEHENVHVMLVNQFGWSREVLGNAAPENMTFADLRNATDVEFGQSVYEPFGIAQLEPLGTGAICIPSSVCGCASSYQHAIRRLNLDIESVKNVIIADYTKLEEPADVDQLQKMTQDERNTLEEHVAEDIAKRLFEVLPRTDEQRQQLIEFGSKMSREMGWDTVLSEGMLPLFERIVRT